MKTTINITASGITVSIAGVTISIVKEELFSSLAQAENFIWAIWPEKRKEDLAGSLVAEFFEKVRLYQPFAEKLLSCMKIENDATSTIVLHEDGTMTMTSSEQSALFDWKKYLEVISEFSELQEEQFREKQAKREQADREAQEELERAEREFEERMAPGRKDRQEADDILEEAINKATDQSMEFMADNEIVFTERPTLGELRIKLNEKLDDYIGHNMLCSKIGIDPNNPMAYYLTSANVVHACDVYGCKAVLRYMDPAYDDINGRAAANRKKYSEEETE